MNVAPPVNHLRQLSRYDCWHASLRMVLKWKHGLAAEPAGTHTTWLYAECMRGEAGYTYNVNLALQGIANPTGLDRKNAALNAKTAVERWARTRRIAGYRPFQDATRPGLTISLLPMILGENGLRAVRGASIVEELGATPVDVDNMLTAHGPLYCLVSFGHVVVVTGINGMTIDVCDPLMPAPDTRNVNLVVNSPCVARLA